MAGKIHMNKIVAALFCLLVLAAISDAHPAYDAAQAVFSSKLRPGWCRHYTKAAIDAGAVGYVHLAPKPGRTKNGVGHITPVIVDGRGKMQVLVESSHKDGFGFEVNTLIRKTKPDGVDIETWALSIFGDSFQSAEFGVGSPSPLFDCIVGSERALGLRRNMSMSEQRRRTSIAKDACFRE